MLIKLFFIFLKLLIINFGLTPIESIWIVHLSHSPLILDDGHKINMDNILVSFLSTDEKAHIVVHPKILRYICL